MKRDSVGDRAELIHMAWVKRLVRDGVTSRLSYWGEELMVPWAQLTERAKRYNRDSVEDNDAARELLDDPEDQ